MKEYDGEGNDTISFNEFIKMVIPAANRPLRKQWVSKY